MQIGTDENLSQANLAPTFAASKTPTEYESDSNVCLARELSRACSHVCLVYIDLRACSLLGMASPAWSRYLVEYERLLKQRDDGMRNQRLQHLFASASARLDRTLYASSCSTTPLVERNAFAKLCIYNALVVRSVSGPADACELFKDMEMHGIGIETVHFYTGWATAEALCRTPHSHARLCVHNEASPIARRPVG